MDVFNCIIGVISLVCSFIGLIISIITLNKVSHIENNNTSNTIESSFISGQVAGRDINAKN